MRKRHIATYSVALKSFKLKHTIDLIDLFSCIVIVDFDRDW